MIVCPYNPAVLMDDIHEAFYCEACPECRLLSGLFPVYDVYESEDEEK